MLALVAAEKRILNDPKTTKYLFSPGAYFTQQFTLERLVVSLNKWELLQFIVLPLVASGPHSSLCVGW